MWLLIHAGIKVNHGSKSGPDIFVDMLMSDSNFKYPFCLTNGRSTRIRYQAHVNIHVSEGYYELMWWQWMVSQSVHWYWHRKWKREKQSRRIFTDCTWGCHKYVCSFSLIWGYRWYHWYIFQMRPGDVYICMPVKGSTFRHLLGAACLVCASNVLIREQMECFTKIPLYPGTH